MSSGTPTQRCLPSRPKPTTKLANISYQCPFPTLTLSLKVKCTFPPGVPSLLPTGTSTAPYPP